MENWRHMAMVRELVRGEDSTVERHSIKVEEIRERMKNQS